MCVLVCMCPLRGLETNDTSIAMSISNGQILASKYYSSRKEIGICGKK